ncbi:hypothetical protein ACTWPT_55815 [Nonomuraea sp. 3N208]|uniref:hypothetical protein n=1 Tax=Nonomuraea sp. 3N208 TaxID=3457421 RepID=UPI003FD1D5A2
MATGISSRAASRAPARAAMLTATDVSSCLSSGVKWACGLVSPSTCSANVAAAHLAMRE